MIKTGAYFLVDDGRDDMAINQRPTTVLTWVTDNGSDPDTGLQRLEVKYTVGNYGIALELDDDAVAFEGDKLTRIETADGPLAFMWATPAAAKLPAVVIAMSNEPELAERLAAQQTEDELQQFVYDACCAEYPS